MTNSVIECKAVNFKFKRDNGKWVTRHAVMPVTADVNKFLSKKENVDRIKLISVVEVN